MSLPRVTAVRPLGGYRIHLTFNDGVAGELDLAGRIQFSGVFEPLSDEAEFAKVRVDLGTVAWPNGADICPDVLYSWLTGQAVPGSSAPSRSS